MRNSVWNSFNAPKGPTENVSYEKSIKQSANPPNVDGPYIWENFVRHFTTLPPKIVTVLAHYSRILQFLFYFISPNFFVFAQMFVCDVVWSVVEWYESIVYGYVYRCCINGTEYSSRGKSSRLFFEYLYLQPFPIAKTFSNVHRIVCRLSSFAARYWAAKCNKFSIRLHFTFFFFSTTRFDKLWKVLKICLQ